MWYIHKKEYYSVTNRNGVLTHAVIWMNHEDMQSKRNQTQKMTYYVFYEST